MDIESKQRVAENSKSDYTTSEHFRTLFTEDANGLYLLSFLLTADHEMAERCFVAGLDDCMNENSVFQEWVHSWARRIIVRNAIRMVAPHLGPTRSMSATFDSASMRDFSRMPWQDAVLENVLMLEDLERFVYVLSVLERCSDPDCAALLGISLQDVREARVHALKQIADRTRQTAAPPSRLSSVGVGRSEQ